MIETHEPDVNGQFRLWTFVHSFCFLVLGTYSFFLKRPGDAQWTVLASAALGVCSFLILMFLQGRSSLSAPNAVTLLRLVFTCAGVLLLSYSVKDWGVFMLFAIAGITDFFDGFVARRKGSTLFGAKLDMELDAFFIFVLALVAYVYYQQKQLVIVAGLLRYAYVFLLLLLPDLDSIPSLFRFLSKGACAITEIVLVIAIAPLVGSITRNVMTLTVVCLLCASFLLDAVLRMAAGMGGTAGLKSDIP